MYRACYNMAMQNTKFSELGLSKPITDALSRLRIEVSTDVQSKAIPVILDNQDAFISAQTGTGKTAAFALPIIEKLLKDRPARSGHPKVLVIAPTRELALQLHENIVSYCVNTNIRSCVVFGGAKIRNQIQQLKSGVEILIATPGRLIDLSNQGEISYKDTKYFVLDEADRLLDMGFINDINKVIKWLPKKRQNILLSATYQNKIKNFAHNLLKSPVSISTAQQNSTATTVTQHVITIDKKKKPELLIQMLKERSNDKTIVFTRTKHMADRMKRVLKKESIESSVIHGGIVQNRRINALNAYKTGKTNILVATDVASRGLDISNISLVINLELPDTAEDYVHRIGRSGRAGQKGEAVSFVCADEHAKLLDIERFIKKILERRTIDGFEPMHTVPESRPIQNDNERKPSSNKARSNGRSRSSSKPKQGASAPKGKQGQRADSSPTKRKRKPKNKFKSVNKQKPKAET